MFIYCRSDLLRVKHTFCRFDAPFHYERRGISLILVANRNIMGDQKDVKSSSLSASDDGTERNVRTTTKHNRRERRAARFIEKTRESPAEQSDNEDAEDLKSKKEPEREETLEEKKKRIQTLSESKGWTCPITLEGFYKPVLFMDGITYEEDAIRQWWKEHANAKTGPTGIPLVGGEPISNDELYKFLHYGNDLICSITREPFEQPVVLMGGKGQASDTTFEANALIGALEATWAKWDITGQRSYIRNSETELNLNSYSLVPNRILWKGKIKLDSLPALPKRLNAPSFDPSVVSRYAKRHIMDTEDGKLNSDLGISKESGTGNIEQYKNKWFEKCMFDSHGKMYHFINCHFQNVVFSVPCWCGFRMDWCKFTNCVWMGGQPREGRGFLNTTFVSCHVLRNPQKESVKSMLIGIQTNWNQRYEASRNLTEGELTGVHRNRKKRVLLIWSPLYFY